MTTSEQDSSTSPSSPQATLAAGDTSAPNPSQKMEFWRAVFESIEGDIKVNFDKLARFTGYKNAASASTGYFSKRKTSPWGDGSKVAKTPKTPKAPKASIPLRPAHDTEAGAPKKRGRGRPPKPKNHENETPEKRGRGRPPKPKNNEEEKVERERSLSNAFSVADCPGNE